MTHDDNQGKSILLVDDENNLRTLLVDLLKFSLDGEVSEMYEANNGQAACDIVQKEYPHVVLMDVMMPIMDGITACRTMLDQGYKGHIILFSNKDQGPDLLERSKATAVLLNKTDQCAVLATIKEYLSLPHYE